MEGLQRMQDSIAYIEKNLDGNLRIDDIAKVAYMSKFHFQRMFHMLTGYTVGEYIRNRRVTVATQELIHTNAKVVDVALKYGYESPEAFSKAFRNIHGVSPTTAKKTNQSLKAYPKLSFQIKLKGDVEMDYKLVEKEAFTVIGKSIRTSCVNGENHRNIAKFWQESNHNGLVEQLARVSGSMGLMGICLDFDQQQEHLTYLIAAEKAADSYPSDWEEREIPAATWAVFPVRGAMPDAMPKVWERIFTEWFASTGYEHAGGPEIEVYPSDGDPSSEDYYSEIWITIKK